MAKLPLLLLASILLSACIPCGSAARRAFACGGGPEAALPFCNASLPISARAADLIGRLTLDEKIGMLGNSWMGVPRLGIQGYEWWSEALHGVSDTGPGVRFGGHYPGATSFPQVIATTASFNATLWELIGKAVSDEGRAMYNGGRAGLTFWSPNVNIFRDPRWGRGQETAGEDPAVAARFGVSYVRGLQQPYVDSHNQSRLKVAACCKHYTAYDLDRWQKFDRYHFDAKVSKQDLEDTFNVPFKACVLEGKVASIMCSYNKVNGVPTCADPHLLDDTVRRQWALDGYIVSDCDSVSVFYYKQKYTSTPEDAAAVAMKAGLDLDCGRFLADHSGSAVKQGKISEAQINVALSNTIPVQMRLGMYDGEPSKQTFGKLGPKDVCSQAHQNLALEAARQGIVLLQNNGGALPLSSSHLQSIAVVGPNSNATVTMKGNYAGVPCGYTSPLQGIEKYVKKVDYQMGCTNVTCIGNQPIEAAVEAARQSDATILVVGLDQSVETEGKDRVGLLLPGRQQELVSKVATASKGPAILVLMSGGPVDVTFAKNDKEISAILWVGYPGQAGGAAIADVIFGAFNPGGKLPMTWYPQEYVEKVPMTNMAMRANLTRGYPGRSYRFYKGPVVYPYGYGLSYTKFNYSLAYAPTRLSIQLALANCSMEASKVVHLSNVKCKNLFISIHVDVKNIGDRDGSHTILMYSTSSATQRFPQKQLVAFEKVHVAAGEQVRVKMSIKVCKNLSFVDENGIRMILIGKHTLQIDDLIHSISFEAKAQCSKKG